VPDVLRPVPVAKPDVPVIVEKATDSPRKTDFVCEAAVGAVGATTVGVIVELIF
jgi:hypothetical protein